MISDDELLLYHYADGLSASQRSAIAQQLQEDPALRTRYQQLRAELAAFPQPATRMPSAHALTRWQYRLDQRAKLKSDAAPRWPLVLAGATMMLLGVAIGTRLAERLAPAPPTPGPSLAALDHDPQTALRRGLRSHFGDTRQVLASLPNDDPHRRQQLLDDVLAQNRLFERAALAQGNQRLARVLRAIEPVLTELAEDGGASTDAAARAQLDFELAIMQTKLSRSSSKIVQSL